jgi:uncharacterized membrane protein YgcG
VAAGDPFSAADRAALDAAIRKAEQLSRAEFSIFVGKAEGDPHAFATRLHNSLVAPARSILIMVDTSVRAIEVVTGAHVRRNLTDNEVQLAVVAMQTAFAVGDLVGGLRRGVAMLADHARSQKTLHAQD